MPKEGWLQPWELRLLGPIPHHFRKHEVQAGRHEDGRRSIARQLTSIAHFRIADPAQAGDYARNFSLVWAISRSTRAKCLPILST
jgi:hypothetical protein